MRLRNVLVAITVVTTAVVSIAAAPAPAATPQVPVLPVAAKAGVRPIPGAYVVQMRPGTDARALARALAVTPRHTYDSAVVGFAADLTPRQLDALRRHPHVLSIEQDAVGENVLDIDYVTQYNPPSWGIDRIDERSLPLTASYRYPTGGGVVHAYVIDTGIAVNHPDFGGRATFDFNSIDPYNVDCEGHGTHVAGTIGSASYGVAKSVRLHAVKMLNCNGSTTLSAAVAAINWVKANAVKPAVANTSWGWPYSPTLRNAIVAMIDSGVFLASSAGNTGGDACDDLPRAVPQAIVVGSIDSTDTRAISSSVGACVDIYAPGVYIWSTLPLGSAGPFSGTSMATPHVTGSAALVKSVAGDLSQAALTNYLLIEATTGVVKGDLYGTPNRLLWNPYGACNC